MKGTKYVRRPSNVIVSLHCGRQWLEIPCARQRCRQSSFTAPRGSDTLSQSEFPRGVQRTISVLRKEKCPSRMLRFSSLSAFETTLPRTNGQANDGFERWNFFYNFSIQRHSNGVLGRPLGFFALWSLLSRCGHRAANKRTNARRTRSEPEKETGFVVLRNT